MLQKKFSFFSKKLTIYDKRHTINHVKIITSGGFKLRTSENCLKDKNRGINLSIESVSNYISGETVLVTGGGSIGSEICRHIAKFKPSCLLIYDIYENNAFDIQMELKHIYKEDLDIKVIIGSIQDKKRLSHVFSCYKPTIIFHSAAHKHVPLMEENPQEAIKNNIIGTLNLAECADSYGCSKFLLISTDKAVHPTSVMGLTKKVAESIMQYMNKKSKTCYASVRFGNVIGSNGSAIPLFRRQIKRGGPVTITHPDVTRYFMSIAEAAYLVIQSGAMMTGGEIFILDMGEPIKIIDIAKNMILHAGFVPEKDIKIEFIGLRPGEKLNEELFSSEDEEIISKEDKILTVKPREVNVDSTMSAVEAYRLNTLESNVDALEFLKMLLTKKDNPDIYKEAGKEGGSQ